MISDDPDAQIEPTNSAEEQDRGGLTPLSFASFSPIAAVFRIAAFSMMLYAFSAGTYSFAVRYIAAAGKMKLSVCVCTPLGRFWYLIRMESSLLVDFLQRKSLCFRVSCLSISALMNDLLFIIFSLQFPSVFS